MIDFADKDRDGAISYEEFVNVVTKVYPKVWFDEFIYKFKEFLFRDALHILQ